MGSTCGIGIDSRSGRHVYGTSQRNFCARISAHAVASFLLWFGVTARTRRVGLSVYQEGARAGSRSLLLLLRTVPKNVELLGRKVLESDASFAGQLLHTRPAATELLVALRQRALGVDALHTRNVDQREEQVAKLERTALRALLLAFELVALLAHLLPHA